MNDTFIHAPFTAEQVDALNRYQHLGHVHPFTCPNHSEMRDVNRALYATVKGWRCPHCDYEQSWAHEGMMHVEALESRYKLPCDVMLPPATIYRKGLALDVLMAGFEARHSLPAEENRFDDPLTVPKPEEWQTDQSK